MTYGELFAGVGGMSLGLERAGMSPQWFVEIDPYCRAVLRKHWPDVPLYEDVKDVGGRIPNASGAGSRLAGSAQRRPDANPTGDARTDRANLAPVDLIAGGFPCQDLSVAGRRAGMAGERSGLWFEFHRILAEMRPRWCLVENVPGLLSSNGGADFAILLRGLVELGYRCEWRVLDSQHFGVPQRRRRVFIVGCLGEPCGLPVLLEPEGVRGDSEASRAAGEGVAAAPGAGVASESGPGWWRDGFGTLRAEGENRPSRPSNIVTGCAVSVSNGEPRVGDVMGTLDAARESRGSSQQRFVVTGAVSAKWSKGTGGPSGDEAYNLVAHTLRAEGFDASEDGTGRGTPVVAFSNTAGATNLGMSLPGCPPITTRHGDPGNVVDAFPRRLTPMECERLQGWPDDWTRWRDDGKENADGPRYRMCGNGVVGTVAEWLGRRILEAEGVSA